MRPCNALSISEATGIPRETVRRKIDMLINKGWVYKNEKGHIYLTPEVAKHFEHFLFNSIEALLPSAQALIDVLSKLPQSDDSKGR
jgi:DNA-binding IclR family transcriptional regulator